MDSFCTIKAQAQHELTEKKSKFLGYAAPASTEDEAKRFISLISSKHHDAAHNVYAFSLGMSDEIQRSNDDGEPSGTAGRPLLEAIKHARLKNTVLVVTRYFGGILLGAGGLTRTYGRIAAETLAACEIIMCLPAALYQISFDYNLASVIEACLISNDCEIKNKLYMDKVTISCLVPRHNKELFEHRVREIASGEADIFLISEYEYISVNK